MIHDVIAATYKGEYLIELLFDDGEQGIVDFSPYLEKGGVFEQFRNRDFFRDFCVNDELGVLTWGEAIDIAPETLYTLATGKPLPDWTTTNEYTTYQSPSITATSTQNAHVPTNTQ